MALLERVGLLLPDGERERVGDYFEARAQDIDRCQATTREGIRHLLDQGLIPADSGDAAVLERLAEVIATVAWSDMSTAFSLWCHQMVLAYLGWAPDASYVRERVRPRLGRLELLGSTALASAIAHALGSVPLPIVGREEGDDLVLDGRVNWASNLFAPDFAMVTAVGLPGERSAIVAVPGDAPGLRINPYPQLLALQATGSSSLALEGVRLSPDWLITRDLAGFVERVRPPFLVLQSSFCWGLAARALSEARGALRGIGEVFRADLEALDAESGDIATRIRSGARDRSRRIPVRSLVELRLAAARHAVASVALEAKMMGGRGYVISSPTARRLREAAFLPVQSPTEGQLRWELSRSV